jgi:tetratricopeptide (TPR) repeat protein
LLQLATSDTDREATRLALGRELARAELSDEAVLELSGLDFRKSMDPATLLFYRGGALQTLGQYERAIADLTEMEKLPAVPRRYLQTARLIQERLSRFDPEKLPGIAQDMREIRRRLAVGKPDERTRHLQKDVLARLDKLIKDTEKKCQACEGSSGGQPSKPADQSKLMPEKGKGEIADGRNFKDFRNWGNLPPKEREKVLQNLGKDLPANYRAAVEAYFQKLADESGNDGP